VAGSARPRPRIALAASLPRDAVADAELLEAYLTERLPVDEVRRRVIGGLPEGFRLVDLEDEWIAAPSLASRVTGAVYRVEVESWGPCPPPRAGEASAIQIGEWDAERGWGRLSVRVQRDEAGRMARPSDIIGRLEIPLRILSVNRVSIDLAGE
jgi:Uncharacterized protein conserved in bacteria (DUF2344)